MAGVGVAARLVGNMEGWEVPVHNSRCALINVACTQGWTGKILIYEDENMLHGTAHIARRNSKRYVASTEWPVMKGGQLVAAIFKFGNATLKHMQISQLPCAAPAWACSATELVECAAQLAETKFKKLMVLKTISPSDWVVRYAGDEPHLVRMMPESIVVLFGAEQFCFAVQPPIQLHVRHVPFVTGYVLAAQLLNWLRGVFT